MICAYCLSGGHEQPAVTVVEGWAVCRDHLKEVWPDGK